MSAQVAVAVAGFAGVVAAFGSESIHDWSSVDRMRLRFLLIGATLPLIFSLFGLALLAASLSPAAIHAWCSGAAFVVQGTWQWLSLRDVRRTARDELIAARWNVPVYSGQWAVVSLLTLLQLYNAAALQAFWPFYALLIAQLASSVVTFIRLILNRGSRVA